MARFSLSDTLAAEMAAHCESGYPDEACGILVGPAGGAEGGHASNGWGEVTGVYPCRNLQNALHTEDATTHPRDARTAYRIDPADLFRITREGRDAEFVFRAIYHSHVDVGAYFSDEDQRQAAPVMTLSATGYAASTGMSAHAVAQAVNDGTLTSDADAAIVTGPVPAYPELLYLVVDVTAGRAQDCRGFMWQPESFRYEEVPVQIPLPTPPSTPTAP